MKRINEGAWSTREAHNSLMFERARYLPPHLRRRAADPAGARRDVRSARGAGRAAASRAARRLCPPRLAAGQRRTVAPRRQRQGPGQPARERPRSRGLAEAAPAARRRAADGGHESRSRVSNGGRGARLGSCPRRLQPELPPRRAWRLDKWLWAARFFKTRSAAAQAVDGGKVDVGAERAKRSRLGAGGATSS